MFGRQRRCFFGLGLHVSTHFAHSPLAQASRGARGGRGSSFEGPRWQSLRLSGFFPSIVGRHMCMCTVQKLVSLFAHVSCQCAEFGAHLWRRSSFLLGRFLRSACCSPQRIIKNASLVQVWPTFTTILSWSHNDRVCSDFVCSLVKSGSFTFFLDSKCLSGIFCVYKESLSLRLILDARRSSQLFWVPPKVPMVTGRCIFFACRTSCWEYGCGCGACAIASGDVQNAFHHMGTRTASAVLLFETFCQLALSA